MKVIRPLQNSFQMELSSSKLQRLVKCKAVKSLDSRCKTCISEFRAVQSLCSVPFSMHCFHCIVQCSAVQKVRYCVLHCEMKQLVLHQDLVHQFILIFMQSSHPFTSFHLFVIFILIIASGKDFLIQSYNFHNFQGNRMVR